MKISKDQAYVTLDDGTTVETGKLGIFDAGGQQLPFVFGYDTETQEVEMMIKLKDDIELDDGERLCHLVLGPDMKPHVAKFILPGSYAMDAQGKILK